MAENLLKSTSTVGTMTLLSRVLGFTRDMLCAALFGATAGYDAFLVAFKIPNFLRSLFAEGAFSQAFVPLLAAERVHEDRVATKNFIDNISGCLAIICLVVTLVGICAAPWLIKLFAPGFIEAGGRYQLAVELLKITFPYLFFITLTALAGGILNSYNRFAPPAFTPVLLNLSMIFAAIVLSPLFAEPVTALAWGVFLGGIAQMVFQVPFLLKLGLLPRFKPRFGDPSVKRLLKQMMPALLGVSLVQINLLMSTLFASFLPVGSLSWLYYADRLMQFPLGVFGVALSTVVLPHLSRRFAEQNEQAYQATLAWAVNMALLIGLPAAIGLYSLATPLISVLFQHGAFHASDTLATTGALKAYGLGIVGFILVKVLAAAFYARQEIRIPVRIAMVCLVVNVILSGLLLNILFHVGLALANTITALANAFVLLGLLVKKGHISFNRSNGLMLSKILLACSTLWTLLWLLTPQDDYWLHATRIDAIEHLSLLLVAAIVIYFSTLRGLGMTLQALKHDSQ